MVAKVFKVTKEDYLKYKVAADFMLKALQSEKKLSVPLYVDWEKLIHLIILHNLGYILLSKLKSVPKKYCFILSSLNVQAKNKNIQYKKLIDKISDVFNDNNIDFMLLKGARRLDSSGFKRPMDDIDILINKYDFKKAKFVLSKFMSLRSKPRIERLKKEACFKLDDLLLELKYKLHNDINISLSEIRKLKFEEEFLFCFEAYHAIVNHPYQRLKWFYDGYLLLKNKNLDYKIILKLAKRYKIEKAVKIYLLSLNKLFSLKIPKNIFKKSDLENFEIYFNIFSPVYPFNVDVSVVSQLVSVRSSLKLKYLLSYSLKHPLITGSIKKSLKMFKESFYSPFFNFLIIFYSRKKLLYWSRKDLQERRLRFQILSIMNKDVLVSFQNFYVDEELFLYFDSVYRLACISKKFDLRYKSNQVKQILEELSSFSLEKSNFPLGLCWLVDLWNYELFGESEFDSILSLRTKNPYQKHVDFFSRRVLLSDTFLERLKYLSLIIFPKHKINGYFLNLLNTWFSHLFNLKIFFRFIYFVFLPKKRINLKKVIRKVY